MKKFLLAALLMAAAPAFAADVGVSIQISEPGVYGRIDIGRFPQPQVIVAQPVMVLRPQVVVQRAEPAYLWVPPGHRKNWKNHCRAYNACGVPVYFVRHDWYDNQVRRHDRRDDRQYDRRDDRRDDRKDDRRDNRRDDRRDDRGHGKGKHD